MLLHAVRGGCCMKKSNDELIESYKQRIRQIKEKAKKEAVQKIKKDRREFDHQKYILAGSILKVLNINENANAETVKELLPSLIGFLDSKKDYLRNNGYKEKGEEILKLWCNE
jgi:hypothetical protein